MFKVGRFHGCELALDAVFLCVEEEGDCPGLEKDLSGGVLRDDPVLVVKLHILEAELDRPPERVSLCVLAGSQAEEEGNMDEVG